MNISNIVNVNLLNYKKLDKINFASQSTTPIDKFKKRQLDETELYQQKLQENPDIAFIYDPNLSRIEKIKILNSKPYLISANAIGNKINIAEKYWANPRCFKIETFRAKTDEGRYTRNVVHLIDTSDSKSAAALEIIKKLPKSAMSTDKFLNTYKMSTATFEKCIKNGTLEKMTLPDLKTGEPIGIEIIDISTPKNAILIKRFNDFRKKQEKTNQAQ